LLYRNPQFESGIFARQVTADPRSAVDGLIDLRRIVAERGMTVMKSDGN
jgi:hypothetical protein